MKRGKSAHISKRNATGMLVASALAYCLVSGCDSGSFVPARPPELASRSAITPEIPAKGLTPDQTPAAARSGSTAQPKTVEVILCRRQTGDRILMEQILRKELGKARVSLRMMKPEGAEPLAARRLAEEIQRAASRGVALLVLEPLDTPEVRAAIREAESIGVAILLLDQTLPSRQSDKNLPTLSLTGFAQCSKQLVAAALEAARRQGLPSDGTALLVQNRSVDSYSKQRQESIRTALKDSGRVFDVLEFEGGRTEANSVLVNYLKAHPKVSVILTEEDYGLGGVIDLHRVRSDLGVSDFVVAGYASYDLRIDPEVALRCSGFVERSLADYALKISELARAAVDGKPLPEQTGIDVVFVRPEPKRKPGPFGGPRN